MGASTGQSRGCGCLCDSRGRSIKQLGGRERSKRTPQLRKHLAPIRADAKRSETERAIRYLQRRAARLGFTLSPAQTIPQQQAVS